MTQRTRTFAVAVVAVAVAATARAAVLTVGPAGSHGTIQAAIDLALANGEDDEIRVQAGTYDENLTLSTSGRSLLISGGWSSSFDCQCGETLVDAGGRGRALALQVSGGSLVVRRMGFTHGVDRADRAFGGGIRAAVSGGTVTIDDCAVRDNAVVVEGGANKDGKGGGIGVELTGSGQFRLTGSEVAGNRASDGLTYGAGVYLVSRDTSQGAAFRIDGNHIAGNVGFSRADIDPLCGTDPRNCGGWLGASWGAGLLLELFGQTVGEVQDNLFDGNRLDIARDPIGNVRATALDVRATGVGNQTTLLRNTFLDNLGPGSSFIQVMLQTINGSTIHFGDSVVASSNVGGMHVANVAGGGTIFLTNLTIADNLGWVGLSVGAWAEGNRPTPAPNLISLANSIILSPNGVPLLELNPDEGTSFEMTSTTVGKRLDLKFRNRAGHDYRLTRRSIAVDKGIPKPPGGLGSVDVAGEPRRKGRGVDRGAYESY